MRSRAKVVKIERTIRIDEMEDHFQVYWLESHLDRKGQVVWGSESKKGNIWKPGAVHYDRLMSATKYTAQYEWVNGEKRFDNLNKAIGWLIGR